MLAQGRVCLVQTFDGLVVVVGGEEGVHGVFDPVSDLLVGLTWNQLFLFAFYDLFLFPVVLQYEVIDIFSEFLLHGGLLFQAV